MMKFEDWIAAKDGDTVVNSNDTAVHEVGKYYPEYDPEHIASIDPDDPTASFNPDQVKFAYKKPKKARYDFAATGDHKQDFITQIDDISSQLTSFMDKLDSMEDRLSAAGI